MEVQTIFDDLFHKDGGGPDQTPPTGPTCWEVDLEPLHEILEAEEDPLASLEAVERLVNPIDEHRTPDDGSALLIDDFDFHDRMLQAPGFHQEIASPEPTATSSSAMIVPAVFASATSETGGAVASIAPSGRIQERATNPFGGTNFSLKSSPEPATTTADPLVTPVTSPSVMKEIGSIFSPIATSGSTQQNVVNSYSGTTFSLESTPKPATNASDSLVVPATFILVTDETGSIFSPIATSDSIPHNVINSGGGTTSLLEAASVIAAPSTNLASNETYQHIKQLMAVLLMPQKPQLPQLLDLSNTIRRSTTSTTKPITKTKTAAATRSVPARLPSAMIAKPWGAYSFFFSWERNRIAKYGVKNVKPPRHSEWDARFVRDILEQRWGKDPEIRRKVRFEVHHIDLSVRL